MPPTPTKKQKKPADDRTTKQRQDDFLKAFAEVCNIKDGARLAEIDRNTHYDWIDKNPGYADRFERQRRVVADKLEAEAVRRAYAGYDEPVYHQGELCGHIKRYSDGLMQFLLRGMMPEKYGVQKQEISGPSGQPLSLPKIEVVFVDPPKRSEL